VSGPSIRLRLRVTPGAARSSVVGAHGDAWKVRVTSAPERGKANQAVLELLSDALRVPRTRLTLVTGHAARDKMVAVEGLSETEATRRLSGAAGAS
jgi:uncharacterized protein (TIGR00251 family)